MLSRRKEQGRTVRCSERSKGCLRAPSALPHRAWSPWPTAKTYSSRPSIGRWRKPARSNSSTSPVSDFDGYEEGSLLDDAVFGTRHFTDFEKIAFVTEDGPYDRAVSALKGLMPTSLKVFRTREIDAAKKWLAAA